MKSVIILSTFLLTAISLQSQQASAPKLQNPQPSQAGTTPLATIKVSTRMVALQVSVRDGKGHPVTGLTADDFQLFEQVLPKKDQRPQRIAAFQSVNVAAIAAADKGGMQLPRGVYSNLVTMQKMPVPPTILLMDGLNTNLAAQMQVHRQMVKLLTSIPTDIPVAVFLLDRNLHLLQNFSTDRTLLRTAVDKALSLGGSELTPTDVRADPDALATLVQDNPPPGPPSGVPGAAGMGPELQQVRNAAISAQVQELQNFEREASTSLITIRVQTTIDAFRSIARHVTGYPGRKNLLWIASSFPLTIFPDSDFRFAGMEEFQDKVAALANELSDAKIALYPMDPAGLEAQSFYDASARPSARNASVGTQTSATLMHEENTRASSQQSMRMLAQETGGQVCVNNNDLSDCVKKAVDDGSSYYELAYYPDSADWDGEFHRIIVKTQKPGVHLAFRQGYYARPTTTGEGDDVKRLQSEMREAACHDLLTATNILVMAQTVAPQDPANLKYFLAIDPRPITFSPANNARRLSILVAGCSFDKDGNALQYLQQPTETNLSEQEYNAIMAQHGFTRTLEFKPAPGTTRVRLLVRDIASGKMGSVEMPVPSIPVSGVAHAAPTLKRDTDPPAPK